MTYHVSFPLEFKFAFDRYSNRKIDSLGVEYDYKSVMHYGSKAFSKNGLPTIVARDPSVKRFGNTRLSLLDIRQAKLLYDCPGRYTRFCSILVDQILLLHLLLVSLQNFLARPLVRHMDRKIGSIVFIS